MARISTHSYIIISVMLSMRLFFFWTSLGKVRINQNLKSFPSPLIGQKYVQKNINVFW